MTQVPLPPIGSVVDAERISIIKPRSYKQWQLVAQAELADGGHGGEPIRAWVPIEEISPYLDFDPATARRSLKVKMRMCELLLRGSDRQFVVLEHVEGKNSVIVSLKRAIRANTTVVRTDHEPRYVVYGFGSLRNLHYHVLKHALGLGGGAENWEAAVSPETRSNTLRRLKGEGCPAALQFDGREMVLRDVNPCASCSLKQKMRCFEVLRPARSAYEREALQCLIEASDRTHPRHYHYTEAAPTSAQSALIFMDARCRKAVAKRRDESYFSLATFFRVDDCDPEAPSARLKFLAERRRRIAAVVAGSVDVHICTPLSWGYSG